MLVSVCTVAAFGILFKNTNADSIGLRWGPGLVGFKSSSGDASMQLGWRPTKIERHLSLPFFLKTYSRFLIVINIDGLFRVRDIISPSFHLLFLTPLQAPGLCPASCSLVPALLPLQPEKSGAAGPSIEVV